MLYLQKIWLFQFVIKRFSLCLSAKLIVDLSSPFCFLFCKINFNNLLILLQFSLLKRLLSVIFRCQIAFFGKAKKYWRFSLRANDAGVAWTAKNRNSWNARKLPPLRLMFCLRALIFLILIFHYKHTTNLLNFHEFYRFSCHPKAVDYPRMSVKYSWGQESRFLGIKRKLFLWII